MCFSLIPQRGPCRFDIVGQLKDGREGLRFIKIPTLIAFNSRRVNDEGESKASLLSILARCLAVSSIELAVDEDLIVLLYHLAIVIGKTLIIDEPRPLSSVMKRISVVSCKVRPVIRRLNLAGLVRLLRTVEHRQRLRCLQDALLVGVIPILNARRVQHHGLHRDLVAI